MENQEVAKKPKKPTTAQSIEELKQLNSQMAEMMLEMQQEIFRLKQDQDHPVHALFRRTAYNVTAAAKTCDEILKTFKNEIGELRTKIQQRLGSLRNASGESGEYVAATRDAYDACEKDINKAIASVENLQNRLEGEVRTANEELKKTTLVDKAMGILQSLSDQASMFRANAIATKADSHRKRATRLNKLKTAILDMDRAIYKHKLRFKNAIHALKDESFESSNYEKKGIVKKITNSLDDDLKEENELATRLQQKADAIKAFCGREEEQEQEEEDSFEEEMKASQIKM